MFLELHFIHDRWSTEPPKIDGTASSPFCSPAFYQVLGRAVRHVQHQQGLEPTEEKGFSMFRSWVNLRISTKEEDESEASSQLSIKPLIVQRYLRPPLSRSQLSITSASPYLLAISKTTQIVDTLDDLAFWLPTQILNDEDPPAMELNSNAMKSGGFRLRFNADAPKAQKLI
ncbi:hypothetical protein DVH24_033047 [Malus domestica]|uniref:Uncharacterized protein n=1 Tax=Malus domestica TaxID=3750 RepID=A0A498ITU2_MALDO|nr:hypothetical protein DVH24_033047 [Malus domestica]